MMQGGVQLISGIQAAHRAAPRGPPRCRGARWSCRAKIDLVLILVGLLVFGLLHWLVYRTKFGRQVIAVAEDRYMSSLLGVSISRVYTVTFAVAIFLAGVGGALAAPTLSMTPGIATTFILYAFAVVIIGGFGSISGSLIASLLLGVLASVLGTYAPTLADFSLYIPMLLILVLRPQGIRGGATREVAIA